MPVLRHDLRMTEIPWEDHPDRYNHFVAEAATPWCWGCGRGDRDPPDWYHAPWFLQRHHIVNKPRVEDRRAVILLCPVCHGRIHGERYRESQGWALTLPAQLWLKRTYDRDFYDRGFLRKHHIGRLPPAHIPYREYRRDYCGRRGGEAML